MKTYTVAELNKILRKHKLWIVGDQSGVRADLRGANLSEAYLRGANLSEANLSEANLRGADLRGADLSEANLSEANLRGADLRGADLSEADLSEADLSEANLRGAYLSEADLSEANLRGANINHPIACPEKGSFTAFKKVRDNFIIELEIPEDALRSSATSRKCRCSKANVISITHIDGSTADADTVYSKHDPSFAYRVGDLVKVDNFDPDRWHECAPGIHFFITRQEAVDY